MYIAKQLSVRHQDTIYHHLTSLAQEDRYNRFCGHMTDSAIARYVEKINYEQDGLFGIFNSSLELVGFAHVAIENENVEQNSNINNKTKAEFAFSILAQDQGKGLGNILMQKAVLFSKAHGVQEIQMNCLATNQKSLHLAKKHGLKVNIAQYGEKTAVLETEHPHIEQFIAQNQIILENHLASLDFFRQIHLNFFNNFSDNMINLIEAQSKNKPI